MPYTGRLPTLAAIKQAVREDLTAAPRDHREFAVYIFERARQIDAQAKAAQIILLTPTPELNSERRH